MYKHVNKVASFKAEIFSAFFFHRPMYYFYFVLLVSFSSFKSFFFFFLIFFKVLLFYSRVWYRYRYRFRYLSSNERYIYSESLVIYDLKASINEFQSYLDILEIIWARYIFLRHISMLRINEGNVSKVKLSFSPAAFYLDLLSYVCKPTRILSQHSPVSSGQYKRTNSATVILFG